MEANYSTNSLGSEKNGLLRIDQRYKGIIQFESQMSDLVRGIGKKKKEREETIMRKEGGWERQRENASKSIRFLNTFVIWLTIAKDQLYT